MVLNSQLIIIFQCSLFPKILLYSLGKSRVLTKMNSNNNAKYKDGY